MSNKNIVSIEDRIPKLKQARKKKANRRLIFYLSIFFFLISIIVYLQSPLSHVKTINVQGNVHTTDEEIINLSEITAKTNIWMVNFDAIEKAIKTNPIVNEVEVNRKLPWTVSIEITEHNVVGYVKEERKYYPILANGVSLKQEGQDTYHGNSPMLIGFTEDEYLQRMAEELNKLPKNITNLISEIHWEPTDNNKNKIQLFMTDGYIVDGTIRNFSEKMVVYPSIVSQLEPGVDGIIHIGVGVYFESFNDESEETDETEE
ncbi:cell division protein FtsQ/DivIB [Oceanobacillus caeni]|uniref:Cell division protein DivIB n=1 Tax=Oceanobacillus caeni TaxID=405946 RepID=A0ABR5MM01_9BACI|nr:cell division protein FtsQ/DivIB [Oceanobacillus caeni]KKE78058.1 cell division protein FtsQ [Bacilli bacterium VT-13-104]PZD85714.1 cell division protein FtsQ/DivIB [Bacilli bacterium]KPH77179.1 cell division protein FtsQ [Oceanobacillus caeni]MBU8790176.1 cell division protein FtsQ/DivIB [Oceanobacillus caeni]MCR1835620.1 cell division protein FtsQ/DivIB [Oceanobacillus caeni]